MRRDVHLVCALLCWWENLAILLLPLVLHLVVQSTFWFNCVKLKHLQLQHNLVK